MSISILKSLSNTSRQVFSEKFPDIDEFEAIDHARKVVHDLASSGKSPNEIMAELQHLAKLDKTLYAGVVLLEINAIESFVAKESGNIH